jgi:hypothetical protein
VENLGKSLVLVGVVIVVAGLFIWFFGRHGGAALPGDIVIERKNVKIYFPIVTCLVISAVLTLVMWLLRR